jgi:hypothetical protein
MAHWLDYIQGFYYTGVGVVLLGTGIRYLHRMSKKRDESDVFLEELKDVHLKNIYTALEQIAEVLDIRLKHTRP